ncbi:MAG: FtsX-like permease family protein [Thermoclostridium sp.]|nr:FtsX-like permease family protein [Thermoclostridium sp.]
MNIMIKKILMDLVGNKTKTALMMLTLFVGAMAVGIVVMFSSFFVPEANKAYQNAQPHDAVIKTDGFSTDILAEITGMPEIKSAEARRKLTVRMVAGDKKINTDLIVLGETNTIDVIRKSDGSDYLPGLGKNELYLERAALEDVDKRPGDTVEVFLEGNRVYKLKIRELVYDAVTEPYTLEGDIVAFINEDTLKLLTGQEGFNEILIRVTGDNSSRDRNTIAAKSVSNLLEAAGITVNEIEVPQPGTFYATQALNAITIIMTLIGSLSILLGIFLIINIINSMMVQHIRQIGIMKAIGGKTLQISLMYIGLILTAGLAVFAIALPLSALTGYLVCNVLAGIMNMELTGMRLPGSLVLAQLAGVVLLPLTAALVPILNSTRSTVYDALNNNIKGASYKDTKSVSFLIKRKSLSPELLVSIRNNFRNKGRMILTLGALTLSGAILIAGINLQKGFSKVIEDARFLIPDGILTLCTYEKADRVTKIAQGVEGLETIEAWGFYAGQFIEPETGNSKKVKLNAPKPDSVIFDRSKAEKKLTEGRLIEDDSKNEIVVSSHLKELYPDIGVGDTVAIRIDGRPVTFEVVGVISLFGRPADPTLIVGYRFLNSLLAGQDMVIDLRGVTREHTEEYQNRVFNEIEKQLYESGIKVAEINLGEAMLEQFSTSTSITVILLMFLAIMIGIVGTIGLSATLSINVIERSREFGVMRSVGATNEKLNRMIIVEGILLTIAAWILGLALSVPLTILSGNMLGDALMGTAAGFHLNLPGVLIWLAVSICGAYIAGLLPCIKINRMVTREVLSYE